MRRKTIISLALVIFALSAAIFSGCGETENPYGDAVRIHIRANGNGQADQDVKMKVRDAVVEFLTPRLASCKDRDGA
ncbi:MAG: stage II sporulation protein R, partial [Clostridiales bacterium]|nr:stage II sporulation protein R [Clostridiales bacterium]